MTIRVSAFLIGGMLAMIQAAQADSTHVCEVDTFGFGFGFGERTRSTDNSSARVSAMRVSGEFELRCTLRLLMRFDILLGPALEPSRDEEVGLALVGVRWSPFATENSSRWFDPSAVSLSGSAGLGTLQYVSRSSFFARPEDQAIGAVIGAAVGWHPLWIGESRSVVGIEIGAQLGRYTDGPSRKTMSVMVLLDTSLE